MTAYMVADPIGMMHVAFIDWDAGWKTLCGQYPLIITTWSIVDPSSPVTCLWCMRWRQKQ